MSTAPAPPSDRPEAAGLDLLLPPQIARACEDVGARKSAMDVVTMAVLAGLAGAFIALGAMLFTVVITHGELGFGPTRLLGGVAFSLGLILVLLAGAELFTGNTLVVMAWANRRVSTTRLLRGRAIVYAGNFVGAVLTALLVYAARTWTLDANAVGATALTIGVSKVGLSFGQAIALGVLCNVLVTLAVWLSLGARSFGGKVVAIVFPITAFVAAGFEHSIANMYFVPLALLLKGEPAAVAASGLSPERLGTLTWGDFLVRNLVPVTIGNVIGGALLVGGVYWFVYLRPSRRGGATP
ncbi:MAG: formate/nitrite transporter family protein [Chloroflexi bacterium]|nr:formate/nitrite transporter family protein [Chloroflexota bacterium]